MPPLRTCRAPAHLLLKSPFTPTSPASPFPPLPSPLLSSHLLTLQLCPAPPPAPAQPSRSLTGWTWQVDCPPFTAPAPHTDCREPRAGIGATAPARPTGRRSGQKIGQLGWGDQPPTQAAAELDGGGAVFYLLAIATLVRRPLWKQCHCTMKRPKNGNQRNAPTDSLAD